MSSPRFYSSTTAPAPTFGDLLQINTPERRPLTANPLPGRNTLISALRTSHSDHVHVLPMSIKFAIRGQINVETRRAVHRLSNTRFLVLNAWEPYTFQIAPRSLAQTFSLFFRAHYLTSLRETMTTRDAQLLEQTPADGLAAQLEFPEALSDARSSDVATRLLALYHAWQDGASQLCLDDRVRDVGESVVRLQSRAVAQIGGIHAAKRSTREELYRRVQLASLFVRDSYTSDINLDRVARQAGMASHHLHRTFRAINDGLTLHQWIVQLRLDEAKRLLRETDLPISMICRRIGYSSLPSFTTLFRARFGHAPSAFRRSGLMD